MLVWGRQVGLSGSGALAWHALTWCALLLLLLLRLLLLLLLLLLCFLVCGRALQVPAELLVERVVGRRMDPQTGGCGCVWRVFLLGP
jgi:hypothetical protein